MEQSMSDFNDLIDRYIDVWNETDAGKRRALIAQTFTEGAHFIDPLQEGEGQAGIEALVRGVQEKFPGYRFRRAGTVDAFRDRVRFRWELAPEGGEVFIDGTDFATVVDGRLDRVTGFFDRVPASG
jgi:SnoaL-like domain